MAQIDGLSTLGYRLRSQFDEVKTLRRDKELEWIECLRMIKGQYAPEVESRIKKNDQNASLVYPKYARAKAVILLARLVDMESPDVGKNWGIAATPEPTLDPGLLQQLSQKLMQIDPQTQWVIPPTEDAVRVAIRQEADRRCSLMEKEMEDQLVELNYRWITRECLRYGVFYGTGIIKGPLSRKKITTSYKTIQDPATGQYSVQPEETETYRPWADICQIWNFYPDMYVSEYEDCNFVYERHVFSKHELRKLAEKPGFFDKTIRTFIFEHPNGNAQFEAWETDLQNIGNKKTLSAKNNRYEVLEFWGYIDGSELADLGVEVPQELLESEVEANLWLLGDKVIKANLSTVPLNDAQKRIPYHVFYFDKDESSVFGVGLPYILKDTQETICAATRAMLDNAACVAGPQLEIITELLHADQDLSTIHSKKIWFRDDKSFSTFPFDAVRVKQFDSHIPELMKIIEQFRQFGDEESALPTYLVGDIGRTGNETVGATAMKMSSLLLPIKDVVKRYDLCIDSFIKALYQWNMEYNENPGVKGDFLVKPLGVTNLLAREFRTQALDYFSQTLTPDDAMFINRYELLKERMKSHELDPDVLLYSEEEAMARMEAQRDKEAEALAKQAQQADIQYTKSKALHMVAKSGSASANIKIKQAEAIQGLMEGTDEVV